MYIPASMTIENRELMNDFIDKFSFGTLISEQLDANHLPFLLKKFEGERGTLYGHFSKANRHLAAQDKHNVLVVLQGPHNYISPSWYASSPAVPTWNYAAVHLKGKMHLLSNDETIKALDETVNTYEPELLVKRDRLSDEYRDRLASGIIGFKIEITHMQGKQKLGQHRSVADQLGVVQGLQSTGTPDAMALLSYMQKVGLGLGE
ncbi:FMN-binding negative transcriptional regulator [Shewanella sp. VB17]|uniref:FMN-binding negative transcriptional regulator n=1 Tax=Shewanella sp. VB17 TaxID=2739432 RepID=UPI001566D41D|nr:FMN-binding negative transcriptional regulator [Shewanella sp. VB17]NRD74926.1 FMN-binding negative transcriptional regulator [Shewanella sp. VB17]